MWFHDIELPDELSQARDDGKLLVFAGAGVSYGPPSSLPLFSGLAERIAENTATLREPNELFDRFLGRLHRGGVRVHELAKTILLDPQSCPNLLHDLLLRLFGKPEAIRLVTTNFDHHFTRACQERWPNAVREYYAPALPRGASFRGVVYLHGAAFIDPRECVLTDEDFGRAYLTEGWATQFLKEMFNHYTVLFIGYSHSDLVMNYLARGLPPSTRRFALHHGSDNGRWAHLGIIQVRYPVEGDDHSALTKIFDAWVRELESGLADSYQRLTQLAAQSPEILSNDDGDFIRRSLSDEDRTKRFLHSARDPAWVVWLEEKGLISELLRADGPAKPAQEEIARWLATHFIDDKPQTLFGLVERHYQKIHPSLWFHIYLGLRIDKQEISEDSFRRWMGILLFQSQKQSKAWVSELVLPAAKRRDIESLLLLLENLVTPRIRLHRSFRPIGEELRPSTFATVDLLQDHEPYWLGQAWEKVLEPALPALAPRLEPIFRRALMLADQFMRSSGMGRSYDPLWHTRQDIERRNTWHSDTFDFLVDASLTVIQSRMGRPAAKVIAHLDDLFDIGIPVLQRLAVAGIRRSSTLSPDEKMRWLLSKRIIHSFWFRTETRKLIEALINSCSEAVKQETLEAVLRGLEQDQRAGLSEEQTNAATFSLLRWLKQRSESWSELDAALDDLLERYPDFETISVPDATTVSLGPRWVDPAEGFDLEAVLIDPPTKFLENWLATPEHDLSERSQWSYGAVLPTIAKRSLSWVLSLGKAALENKIVVGFVWSSIAYAIGEASPTEDDWREILSLARGALALDGGYEFSIRILEHGIHADRNPLPTTLFEDADALADAATPMLLRSTTAVELRDDWVSAAINHPAGWHWRYWMARGIKWRSMQTGEQLPELVTKNLRTLLEENWPGASIARVLCGNQIHLLDYLDSNFARTVGLPLFSWSGDEDRALQTWSGFLAGGHWSVALKEFILGNFIETIRRWQSLPEASRRELGRHLATLAILVLPNPLDDEILSRCIKPLPEDLLESFATTIAHILREMDRDNAEALWSRWLLEYLRQRSLGRPKPWTLGEIQQIPFWLLHARSLFSDAVTAFRQLPGREGINVNWVIVDLDEHAEVFEHPDACAELILAITDATAELLPDPGKLLDIVKRVKSAGVSQHFDRALDERMLRLGIT